MLLELVKDLFSCVSGGGSGGSEPQQPAPPPPPPPPPAAPTEDAEEVRQRAEQERRRQAMAMGLSATDITNQSYVGGINTDVAPTLLGGAQTLSDENKTQEDPNKQTPQTGY